MDERAAQLRRRIGLHRRYLADGIDAEIARHYLCGLAEDEAELAEVEKNTEIYFYAQRARKPPS
jgi:hypothetical protein